MTRATTSCYFVRRGITGMTKSSYPLHLPLYNSPSLPPPIPNPTLPLPNAVPSLFRDCDLTSHPRASVYLSYPLHLPLYNSLSFPPPIPYPTLPLPNALHSLFRDCDLTSPSACISVPQLPPSSSTVQFPLLPSPSLRPFLIPHFPCPMLFTVCAGIVA